MPRGFANAKEFEYSFKKSSVENIKPSSGQPFGNPQLVKPNPPETEDIDKKINWFKSENSRMEYRSDNPVIPRSDYLRLEENRMEIANHPNESRKATMLRGTSRDASILSSANILNELPPLSEIRKPAYPIESKSEIGNLESLSQNYFNIPHAPKLASKSTPDKLDTSIHSVAHQSPQNQQNYDSRTPTAQTQNNPSMARNMAQPTKPSQEYQQISTSTPTWTTNCAKSTTGWTRKTSFRGTEARSVRILEAADPSTPTRR